MPRPAAEDALDPLQVLNINGPGFVALLERLDEGTRGVASDEEFQNAISELRSHEVTQATMAKAREMADEAIAELDIAPDDVVKRGLVRFAHQSVDRSY